MFKVVLSESNLGRIRRPKQQKPKTRKIIKSKYSKCIIGDSPYKGYVYQR